ncbi:MAG TPA: hypothetical protein VHD56_08370 [Tepidisphaeraceae bacterium]|nr:hypothetical protein [Tepidisphaeraceae bacterium]
MSEDFWCRLKFTFLLLLFFAPILACLWSQHLEVQNEHGRYLPALSMQENAEFTSTDEVDSDNPDLPSVSFLN